MADARVEEYGSGYLIRPLNEPAADWLRAFGPTGATWVGAAPLVKPEELDEVVEGMRDDGLDVENGRDVGARPPA
jgi:hypothetical protein